MVIGLPDKFASTVAPASAAVALGGLVAPFLGVTSSAARVVARWILPMLTVAAVACLIYAIVVLIRILCGKYEQVKLPDITFELVDMTPGTEAKPETAPEADSAPETEPEAETAQPEKSEETEDTPDA